MARTFEFFVFVLLFLYVCLVCCDPSGLLDSFFVLSLSWWALASGHNFWHLCVTRPSALFLLTKLLGFTKLGLACPSLAFSDYVS